MDMAANDELAKIWTDIRQFDSIDIARRYAFYQSFFRLYELQFNLPNQGLLDDSIARSYTLIIRMFTKTIYFADYWATARFEFNEEFAAYVDEQLALVDA